MPRLARLVVSGVPHHVTQRGNRRQQTFFSEKDYALYLSLLRDWSAKAETRIWAWCLMPNHVHLILVPTHEDGLRAALRETHAATRVTSIFARIGAATSGRADSPHSRWTRVG